LLEALKLLEHDALGGSGSRGYGRVRFEDLTLDGVSVQEAFDGLGVVEQDRPATIVPV
jgi:CRISPR-associated protein Csm3